MKRLPLLPVLLALTLLSLPAQAVDVSTGKARIIDGDTIEVAGTRFRLKGIDAPERRQECLDHLQQPFDCGAAAVRTLVQLTKGQKVTCEPVRGTGSGERSGSATCRQASTSTSRCCDRGKPWRLDDRSPDYAAAENEARRARAGLWAGTFEHPGCWRAQQRGNECRDRLPTN